MYISIRSSNFIHYIKAAFGICMLLSLVSCSAIKSNDYSIKDSLYVWSESFDETEKIPNEFQTIRSLEDSILKSDVELIFEAMVNNEIAEIDIHSKPSNKELTHKQDTKHENSLNESVSEAETETTLVAQLPHEEIQSIEDINRVTLENPTAAGIPVNQVLPIVKTEAAEIEVSNEIQVITSSSSDYKIGVSEYGMWHLSKSKDSPYQEVCSLTSSTMQVEVTNYSTQVWLNVVGNKLLVNSTTNIDITRPRVGVKLDDGSLEAFEKNYFQTSAVWSGDLESALSNNKQLSISLGGNELGGRTQELAIGLKDLKRAYSEYRKCNRGTQIGSL